MKLAVDWNSTKYLRVPQSLNPLKQDAVVYLESMILRLVVVSNKRTFTASCVPHVAVVIAMAYSERAEVPVLP